MSWDAVGALGEVIGAAAVIATLIYLARQMNHANQTARTSVVGQLQQKYTDVYSLLLSNP